VAGSDGAAGPAGAPGAASPEGESGPQEPQGPLGIGGEQGAGLALQGSVATENDLPASSTVGFAYIVEASGDLYIWNGGAWMNAGPIQGPEGEQGPQGPQGDQGSVGPQGPQGETVLLRFAAAQRVLPLPRHAHVRRVRGKRLRAPPSGYLLSALHNPCDGGGDRSRQFQPQPGRSAVAVCDRHQVPDAASQPRPAELRKAAADCFSTLLLTGSMSFPCLG
jgi:hypothetical protein